jgi:hypothetical protein
MSVTEQDRERARNILNTAPLLDLGGAIAAALADERERAQAGLPEWKCPSCGSTTRARMADQ